MDYHSIYMFLYIDLIMNGEIGTYNFPPLPSAARL